jgi:hypothetical protein
MWSLRAISGHCERRFVAVKARQQASSQAQQARRHLPQSAPEHNVHYAK